MPLSGGGKEKGVPRQCRIGNKFPKHGERKDCVIKEGFFAQKGAVRGGIG